MQRFLIRMGVVCAAMMVLFNLNVQAKGFKYQAVVRNGSGDALGNKSVTLQIIIHRDSPSGASVYSEKHSAQTDGFGLVNIEIGNGTNKSGNIEDIGWGLYDCFLEVALDDGGGFSVVGTTQILSVPLAIFSLDAETASKAKYADSTKKAGYADSVKQENDPLFRKSTASGITAADTARWGVLSNIGSLIPKKISQLQNDTGYIIKEKDSVFLGSPAGTISQGDKEIWNTAYSWGNHRDAAYLPKKDFQEHPASSITPDDKNRWSMAYNWGNHADAGYLTTELDGSATNELQVLSISHDTIYLSNGGYAKLPAGFSGNFRDLINLPVNLDTNTTDDFDGDYSSLTDAPNIAYSTLNKTVVLHPSNNTSSFSRLNNLGTNILKASGDGKVSINSATQNAQLEIGGTEGLMATGSLNFGTAQNPGAGIRLHWYPKKGAFRVGLAESGWWDDANIGNYSIGMGYQTRATGSGSTAIGVNSYATGISSMAIGTRSQATNDNSIALGYNAKASGEQACAISTDYYSVTEASGNQSIAIGSGANTNGKEGAIVIGDATWFQTAYASCDNELTMRFTGGFRFWTDYPDSTAGVYMRHGQSGWSGYCDRNIKENFKKPDDEELLAKLDEMPVTEWNYKSNKDMKYIGPVAQDFYKAFQLGGTDSLGINSICIDGVNMAGVKALIKRTSAANREIDSLKMENKKLNDKINLILEKTGINIEE